MKTSIKIFLAALVFVACGGKKKTKDGIEYIINKDTEGNNIQFGDYIIFQFQVYNHKDSLLQSSYEQGMPAATKVDSSKANVRLNEVFTFVSLGDSLTVFESVDSILAKRPEAQAMPGVQKGTSLKYVFKILHVFPTAEESKFKEKYGEYQKAYYEKQQKKQEEEAQLGMQAEPKKIEDFVKKNPDYQKMPEGYYILKTTKTNGQQAKAGDKVKVNYTGTLLDGKTFDSSVGREPFEFELGKGMVIAGWDLGIAQLKVGEKAKLFIPSQLAYGPRQAGPEIKPFTPLLFEVELLEIVKK